MRDFLYCLIFPHPSNNHRARILHPKILFLLILFFIASSLFSSKFLPSYSSRSFADVSTQELLDATNNARGLSGLAPLSHSDLLANAAARKADDMFTKNYWAHFAPDGTSPWFFIKSSGYNYVYAGENLARGFNSAGEVLNAWMASPDHRANILSGNFKEVGFAVKGGSLQGENTILVVQEFGSREAAQAQATPQVVGSSPTVAPAAEVFVPTVQPTIEPTVVPSPSAAPVQVLTLNLSQGLSTKPNLDVSSRVAILVVLLFMSVFLIDLFIIDRKRVVRFVGHNVDHAIFLGVILVLIVIVNLGVVL